MKQINDKLYINEDNVQGVQKLGDKYILTTINGNNLMITESIYNDLKEYEGGGGGGTSYSAGAGIDITDGTISNTYADVIANPVLAGTESNLEGIEIDGTKYKVGGGKQLYQHNIFCQNTTDNIEGMITIINDDNTPINTRSLIAGYLYNKGFTNTSHMKECCFLQKYMTSLITYNRIYQDGSLIKMLGRDSSGSEQNSQFTTNFSTIDDYVIEL